MPVVPRETPREYRRDQSRDRSRDASRTSGATRRVRRRWVAASGVIAILLAAALLVTCPGHVHGQAPASRTRNIAGTWVLDIAKSDFGGIPGPTADTAVYVRDAFTYHVKQRVTSPGRGQILLAIDWPTDSGSAVSTLPGGGTMTVHAHVEQGVQVFTAELSQGGQTATESGRVELSPDGKVMTRLQTVVPPAGEPVTIRLVYDKTS
jgi:hypothetical protein